MIAYCQSTLRWLFESVGVSQVCIGGDSAGGNLAIHLLSRLPPHPPGSITSSLIISPALDLSLTFPDRATLYTLSQEYDYVTLVMGDAWINTAIHGTCDSNPSSEILKKKPHYSPFYQYPPERLPNPLIVYGQRETLGPSIQDWISRLKRVQEVAVICEAWMPHDYVLLGSGLTGMLGSKSQEGIERIAKHLYDSL